METVEWIDCTPTGSRFEVQTCVRPMPGIAGIGYAIYRHRGVKEMYVCEYLGKAPSKVMVKGDGEWVDGLPLRG